jgi:protein required for attachment to host cells
MSSETIWVLVADGNSARFFMRPNAGIPLREMSQLAVTAKAAHRHHAHPTAVHEPANHGHQARPAHDTLQNDAEREFLRHIAGRLNLAVEESAVGQLILIAPPKALGVLRDHLTPRAAGRIVREIAKDIVHETVPEIDARLSAEHK